MMKNSYDNIGNRKTAQELAEESSYDYSPYGATTAEGIDQPLQWSSEYHDPELALTYYNYRHYNPTDGRWINRDPIGEGGGFNLYGFVGNNAHCYGDYLGLTPTFQHDEDNGDCIIIARLYIRLKAYGNMSQQKLLQEGYRMREQANNLWAKQAARYKKGCCKLSIRIILSVRDHASENPDEIVNNIQLHDGSGRSSVFTEPATGKPHKQDLEYISPSSFYKLPDEEKQFWQKHEMVHHKNNTLSVGSFYLNQRVIYGDKGFWYTQGGGKFTYAHEIGHLLGLRDEYWEGKKNKKDYFKQIYISKNSTENLMADSEKTGINENHIRNIFQNVKCPCGDVSNQTMTLK